MITYTIQVRMSKFVEVKIQSDDSLSQKNIERDAIALARLEHGAADEFEIGEVKVEKA